MTKYIWSNHLIYINIFKSFPIRHEHETSTHHANDELYGNL